MISRQKIRRYCDAIAREFKPKKLILFGSYAYGSPTEDSDVDVLVIMPRARVRGRRPSLESRRGISAGFPVDVLVREPRDITKRLRWRDSFIGEIIEKGRGMYDAGQNRGAGLTPGRGVFIVRVENEANPGDPADRTRPR